MANAEVIMPKMGDGMESGTLLSWKKQDGDVVKVGDIIAEIETDKSNVEIPAEDSGIFKTEIKPGESVPVGAVIAFIGDGSASSTKPTAPTQDANSIAKSVKPVAPQPTIQSARNGGSRIIASPLARRVAAARGVSLDSLKGTGPNGRIIEADVLAYAPDQVQAKPTPVVSPVVPSVTITPASATVTELSAMRKVIAKRMVESKTTIPHFYITVEIDMEAALELRKQLNSYDETLPKISLNDFIVKASALALRKAPEVNRVYQNDKIVQPGEVNVGIAVALDDGLIVPVVRQADFKPLRSLASEAKALIDKARAKKLLPAEYTGGTFTVSNLGSFDVESFIAIIDPAQGAILAVSSIKKIPVVLPNDTIAVRQRMNVTLSGDHRVIDGATGAKFLQELKKIMQNPLSLLEQ